VQVGCPWGRAAPPPWWEAGLACPPPSSPGKRIPTQGSTPSCPLPSPWTTRSGRPDTGTPPTRSDMEKLLIPIMTEELHLYPVMEELHLHPLIEGLHVLTVPVIERLHLLLVIEGPFFLPGIMKPPLYPMIERHTLIDPYRMWSLRDCTKSR
jgi:hypothetical protein